MSQAVSEIIGVACFLDNRPGQAVALPAGHAWPNYGNRGQLSAQDNVIDTAEGLIGLAQHNRAGNVAAIPAYFRPHVDNYRFALANRSVGRTVVRHCPVGARCHNGIEANAVCAEFAHRLFHSPGHFPLGQAFSVGDIEIEQEISRPYVYVSRWLLGGVDIIDHAELAKQIQTPICLDETIVNILIRRNKSEEEIKESPKWQRAIKKR